MVCREATADNIKTKRNGRLLKIGVWVCVILALLGIPAPFLGAAAFLGGAGAMVGLIRNKSIVHKRRYYALALFALGLGFLAASPWRDASRIEDDYTIADLTSADAEYEPTYDLLVPLLYHNSEDPNVASAIGLVRRDINYLRELHQSRPDELSDLAAWYELHRDDLLRFWYKTEEARKTVRLLAEYDQIADLTEPSSFHDDVLTTDSLGTLTYLYMNVVPLMIRDGRIEEGLDELFAWNSFIRMLSVTARNLITKLTCYGALSGCIGTANEIANDPDINEQVLEQLQRHFSPFTQQQVSLRNPLIFEYLSDIGSYSIFGVSPFQKKHSSIRLLRNLTDNTIARTEGLAEPSSTFSVWPFWLGFMPDVGKVDNFRPWYYFYYNPAGSLLISILHTPMDRMTLLAVSLQIRNDLLQCVLSSRLEGQADLTARAYGDVYIVDIERKRIYSPGVDGIAFTKDDIWLPIEPAMLGLAE